MLFLGVISSGRNGSLMGLFVLNGPHPVSSFCIVLRRNELAPSSDVMQARDCPAHIQPPLDSLFPPRKNGTPELGWSYRQLQRPSCEGRGKPYSATSSHHTGTWHSRMLPG